MTGEETHPGPRIAVVGEGPRALWALERLLERLRFGDVRPPAGIGVFGPGELGAGANYDAGQPDYLRLNLPVDQVDAWSPAPGGGPSMESWWGPRQEPGELAVYPPRAVAGRYLAAQAAAVLAGLQALLGDGAVRHHRRRVRLVHRGGAPGGHPGGTAARWWVDDDGPYDEVLLTPGHATDWPGALRHSWTPDLPPLHPRVFPVQDLLARGEVVPGATVLVRGASLTAIDAVLALGFGRGRHPVRNDLHVALASRTGTLMTPKSPAALVEATHRRAGDPSWFRDAARSAVTTGRGGELPGVLQDLAVHLLAGAPGAAGEVAAVLERIEAGAPAADPVGRLRRDVAVAHGEEPLDGTWAVGQAWRVLFADLVECQQAGDPDGPTLAWPGYRRWVPELERLGYGPPLMNAELLLEALDAGVLTVHAGDTPTLARRLGADLVVDAVLPPPGVRDLPADHVLSSLVADGTITAGSAVRGARVGTAAEVLDATGVPVPGLSLVGRATEDVVMGTDTLIRTMHPAVAAWAHRVLCPADGS